MLLDYRGNPVKKLLADTSCVPKESEALFRPDWNAEIYFPVFQILELPEFVGYEESGLPILNKRWIKLNHELMKSEVGESRIIFPTPTDYFAASKMLTTIEHLCTHKNTLPQKWTQQQAQEARKVLGKFSTDKALRETIRFDILFYTIARRLKSDGFAYLSNNKNDDIVAINADFWSWDGAVILGKKVDPYDLCTPVFTWEEFKRSQAEDVRYVPPTQVAKRYGHAWDVDFGT